MALADNELAARASDFYVMSVRDGKSRAAVETHVGETYIQHNHRVPDGPEGFRKRYHDMSHDYGYRDVVVYRAFAGDDTAFLHVLQDLGDGGIWLVMVFLRFEGDKIVEQWDNATEVANLSLAQGFLGGPAAPDGLEDTAQTAAQASSIVQALIDNEPISSAGAFDHRKFRHHDQGEGLRAFPAEWFDGRSHYSYNNVHRVVCSQNFAALLSEGSVDGQPAAITDLFRCEQGLVVEHWGIVETIGAADDAAHSNGKF